MDYRVKKLEGGRLSDVLGGLEETKNLVETGVSGVLRPKEEM